MKELNWYLDMLWKNITVEFVIKFAVIYFFVMWISLVVWVLKDIRNRTSSVTLQIFCVLIPVFLTPFWIFVYLLIRPSKTLYEKYYDEIEENLDIINEIIEERKFALENKVNNSIETEIKNIKKSEKTVKPVKPVKVKTIEEFENKKELWEEIEIEKKVEEEKENIEKKYENKETNQIKVNFKKEERIEKKSEKPKIIFRKKTEEKDKKDIKLTKLKRKSF